jgi:hypothetical protein
MFDRGGQPRAICGGAAHFIRKYFSAVFFFESVSLEREILIRRRYASIANEHEFSPSLGVSVAVMASV